MKNHLKRLLGKKEQTPPLTTFSLTILVFPDGIAIPNLCSRSPIPYGQIFKALDDCRNKFMEAQLAANMKKPKNEEPNADKKAEGD